jgi:hypothetical protein
VRDKIHLTKKIGISSLTTFLTMGEGFATDPTGNFIVNILASPLQTVALNPDIVRPFLISYTLDLTLGRMTLFFSEAVDAFSCAPHFFTIGADPTTPISVQYTLKDSTVSTTFSSGDSVVIILSPLDSLAIARLAPNLGTKVSNTYLSFFEGAISDISTGANPIAVVFYVLGIQANAVIINSVTPFVTSYAVSLQNGTVDFFFNKVINCLATTMTGVRFQLAKFLGSNLGFYSLTKNSTLDCTVNIDNHVRINLNGDLEYIQAFELLLKSKFYTYLTLDNGNLLHLFCSAIKNVYTQ